MNRAILMAGLVLSIAVLATGTIVQSAEAMKPVKDSTTGIKIQCSAKSTFKCTMSSKEGIGAFEIIKYPSGILVSSGTYNSCDKRESVSFGLANGNYVFKVTKCGDDPAVSEFYVTRTGNTVTYSLDPPV